eukprot:TRINITY_DN6179_c0_g3_i5.p1 TRINITY_DN6179_c0_g3~~TRINITY_DN6179_c0_g3_i5.p1  ORF type:complete len:516 (-),score=144.73 TRINITY_DN6179_c0_g3_i5:155-1702(-)
MHADDDDNKEQDKGPLVYQESKVFKNEKFLINVYDNTKRKYVTFEIYGLDTQDAMYLGYNYQDFDALFRFNAELMNPNRKEGRFHWVAERLKIATVGKETKLKTDPEPTEEVPELPVYETNRKIPTGRMDLKERQRLREQMDMLDVKRSENIAKKRARTREKFLKHLFKLKKEAEELKKQQDEKLADERQRRVRMKDEAEKKYREAMKIEKEKRRQRQKVVEVKEERTEEQDEEEYRSLRARWRVLDAEKAKAIAEARENHAQEAKRRADEAKKQKNKRDEIQGKRQAAWNMRNDRIKRKDNDWLRKVLEIKAERLRMEKMRGERNQESLKVLHDTRNPIFQGQLRRTQERAEALEAFQKSHEAYMEKRAIPKKIKLKGKFAEKDKGKGKDSKKAQKSSETDQVLDAIEAKMRAELEEHARRQKLDKIRQDKIDNLAKAREKKFKKHFQEIRDAHRKKTFDLEQTENERKLVQRQKMMEQAQNDERRKQEWARREKMREQNIARKEAARIAALAA